ncbi:hypothetical protein Tco_0189791 [Tanacetum coccineum]
MLFSVISQAAKEQIQKISAFSSFNQVWVLVDLPHGNESDSAQVGLTETIKQMKEFVDGEKLKQDWVAPRVHTGRRFTNGCEECLYGWHIDESGLCLTYLPGWSTSQAEQGRNLYISDKSMDSLLGNSKTSNLKVSGGSFKYPQGKPKLGFWYPRESPIDLETHSSDSDYGGSN